MRRMGLGLWVCQFVRFLIFLWGLLGRYPPFFPLIYLALIGNSGHAAFLDPDVNKMLKKVLNEWGKFLQVSASFLRPFTLFQKSEKSC